MTKIQIKNKRKSYNRFETGLGVFGAVILIASGVGAVNAQTWLAKVILSIICLDSFYLTWCTVQDLYFSVKRRLIPRKSYDYEN